MTPAESLALVFVESEAKILGCQELPGIINRLNVMKAQTEAKKFSGLVGELEKPVILEAIKVVTNICQDALSACDCPPPATAQEADQGAAEKKTA